jgi:hypothetical protein
MQCNRDMIINLTLAAVIVVLLLRRYLQYSEAMAGAEAADVATGGGGPAAAGPGEGTALRHVAPTPTAIPGPSAMRSILGKCKRFQAKDGPTYEFCGFRSVKQILPHGSHYTGFWGKWITEDAGGGKKKYVSQLYSNGENCPGFGNRQTTVTFECRKDAKEIEFVSMIEPDPCKYQLKLGLAQWCDVAEE